MHARYYLNAGTIIYCYNKQKNAWIVIGLRIKILLT